MLKSDGPVAAKICGVTDLASVAACRDGGADFIGLVFFAKSPRHLDLAMARTLADAVRGACRIVALTVDASDAQLDEIVSTVEPDVIQLHGQETVARAASIRQRYHLPIIKAIAVADAGDVAAAAVYNEVADLILFDAKPPKHAAVPGGHGQTFDWSALTGEAAERAFMLSGGLSPDNVAAAIAATGARAVDVSSGVEFRPGQKDPVLIRRFLDAVHSDKANVHSQA